MPCSTRRSNIGFLSQVGIFFWAAAVAICFYTVLLVPAQEWQKEVRYFLVSSGLVTLMPMLGLDGEDEMEYPGGILPARMGMLSELG